MASHYPSSNHTRLQVQSNQCLRDRLVQIDIQIVLLEEERRVVEKKLQSLTYPVLSLPFEVTSKIFVHCLPNALHPEPIFKSSRQELSTPLLLSQICQTWRSVASRTKNLWGRLHISLDEWSRDPTRASGRFVHWIERAGPSVSFVLHGSNCSFTPTSSAILLPIVAQSGRWRDLTLSLPYKDLITENFQSSIHQRLPLLETSR
ncbi:hypothetical protein DFH08DRAFT_241754 [Mycena albidolilacea]|uniref:F-box domain-containing protein n=1 Tax=Mycena albidolilacea TaxID=1033008 RepID=A0AAD7EQ07_9AGAR|nr:hypothetical protein DFH08DRAFT_241754 [Mycena albidolilacea]